MKKIFSVLVVLTLGIAIVTPGCAKSPGNSPQKVSIGTFNIGWLGDGIDDKISRTEEDFKRIAGVISESNVDVMGLQEIKNKTAITNVLKYLPDYSYYIGHHGKSQNVCVIFRNDVKVTDEGEFMPIAVDTSRNRPSLVLKCKKGNFDWKMMIVHFKSSSRYDSTPEMQSEARRMRTAQAEVASMWVDSLLTDPKEQDIFIVGDCNDFPQRTKNPTLMALIANKNIEFLTHETKSCRNEKWFGIDHIICSKSAKKRVITGSDHSVNFYAQYPKETADKISDHCPVIIDFEVVTPDND
ncbi:MAG: endonuclease/exonuclease/phosphatase family protein [Ignavibacteria bacterium]|nr:endonuclease/exonuclease/phosphatase family protein [Ignavibacteria bacterium]